jgi:hypothetical protein
VEADRLQPALAPLLANATLDRTELQHAGLTPLPRRADLALAGPTLGDPGLAQHAARTDRLEVDYLIEP